MCGVGLVVVAQSTYWSLRGYWTDIFIRGRYCLCIENQLKGFIRTEIQRCGRTMIRNTLVRWLRSIW